MKTIPMLQNNKIPATGIMLEDSSLTPILCKEHWYGAHAMLSQDTLGSIADKKGCDLMILPVSVHEIIVVPKDAGRSGGDLQKIVK